MVKTSCTRSGERIWTRGSRKRYPCSHRASDLLKQCYVCTRLFHSTMLTLYPSEAFNRSRHHSSTWKTFHPVQWTRDLPSFFCCPRSSPSSSSSRVLAYMLVVWLYLARNDWTQQQVWVQLRQLCGITCHPYVGHAFLRVFQNLCHFHNLLKKKTQRINPLSWKFSSRSLWYYKLTLNYVFRSLSCKCAASKIFLKACLGEF